MSLIPTLAMKGQLDDFGPVTPSQPDPFHRVVVVGSIGDGRCVGCVLTALFAKNNKRGYK